MKHLIGKDVTKEVTFMDEGVKIRKLTALELKDVQSLIADQNKALKASKGKQSEDEAEKAGMELARKVIRLGCKDSADLEDDDFVKFPPDELNKLTEDILRFCGLGQMDEAGN